MLKRIPSSAISVLCILSSTGYYFTDAFFQPTPTSLKVDMKHQTHSIRSQTSSFKSGNNLNRSEEQHHKLSIYQSTVRPRQYQSELSSSKQSDASSVSTSSAFEPEDAKDQTPCTKLLRLKDRMWVREALEDLTAAEFACKLAPRTSPESSSKEKKKKESVDFENLLMKLERRVEDMCVKSTYGDKDYDVKCLVTYPMDRVLSSETNPDSEQECWSLRKNSGMGSVTYTDEQRGALVSRLLTSRSEIIEAMSGNTVETNGIAGDLESDAEGLEEIREKLQTPDNSVKEDESKKPLGPSLYVRDDGTVDWDGALQDRAALSKFGTSVWARINGQDAESIDENQPLAAEGENKVTAKIVETEAIKEKKRVLDMLELELKQMDKKHTALLNSAVEAGSAVANVNLALVAPELRSEIRSSDDELQNMKDQVAFQTLNYEMERIYTYLDGELGNTATKGYIPLQDRLNVAEFGLLESQIESMNGQIASGGTVDADVLSVVLDQTTDFKRRLGIDYYVTGLTFDQEAIKKWLSDIISKFKSFLAFYGKGVQLFANDIVFSTSLIGRALTGYTLKPREVRTLRRTFKDVITFIPVIIILIIPLSPVGHVMVFGAIQRFFPDFFPSCFTERRQNLLSLYESTEFSAFTIDENWREKLVRILEAAGFVIVDNTRKLLSPAASSEDETK